MTDKDVNVTVGGLGCGCLALSLVPLMIWLSFVAATVRLLQYMGVL
jgi:hypothetical protein